MALRLDGIGGGEYFSVTRSLDTLPKLSLSSEIRLNFLLTFVRHRQICSLTYCVKVSRASSRDAGPALATNFNSLSDSWGR